MDKIQIKKMMEHKMLSHFMNDTFFDNNQSLLFAEWRKLRFEKNSNQTKTFFMARHLYANDIIKCEKILSRCIIF